MPVAKRQLAVGKAIPQAWKHHKKPIDQISFCKPIF
jgi:hypothetical protein